jgi:hypothetical protein
MHMNRINTRTFFPAVFCFIALIAVSAVVSGCGNKTDATQEAQTPSKVTTLPPQAAQQQQATTQAMQNYYLTHAPADQKAKIQAAINQQQGAQNH